MDQPTTDTLKPEEKLNIMAENAKTEAGHNGFMNPGQKRRGRPKGSKKVGPEASTGVGSPGPGVAGPIPGQPHIDPIAELMPLTSGLASFYSNMLVQIAEDQRAALTKEKHEVIAHCSAVCLNQYFPGVLGAHASAIVLGVTVLETSMVAMRFRKENIEKLREEYKLKKQAASQNGQDGATYMAQ